jgi:hypothetical protein
MTAVQITAAGPDAMPSVTTDTRVIAAAELLAERHLAVGALCRPAPGPARDVRAPAAGAARRGAAPTQRDRFQRLQALEDALK